MAVLKLKFTFQAHRIAEHQMFYSMQIKMLHFLKTRKNQSSKLKALISSQFIIEPTDF